MVYGYHSIVTRLAPGMITDIRKYTHCCTVADRTLHVYNKIENRKYLEYIVLSNYDF